MNTNDILTIEEMRIMSEKRYRKKRKRKYKLLDVFSFFLLKSDPLVKTFTWQRAENAKWEIIGLYKGRVKRKTYQ